MSITRVALRCENLKMNLLLKPNKLYKKEVVVKNKIENNLYN